MIARSCLILPSQKVAVSTPVESVLVEIQNDDRLTERHEANPVQQTTQIVILGSGGSKAE